MPSSPLDSAIYRDLLGDAELTTLFSDSAEVRAMLLVEGALAKVQGKLGMIPVAAAEAIHRASLEVQIDPAALAKTTGQNAVPVPGLIDAFRKEIGAPDYAQYVHWGATSQDIMDTGLALRLRQVLSLLETRLGRVLDGLADLAEAHADLPMSGRTYGQAAVPTSFGAVAATWGYPLLAARDGLDGVRGPALSVSLSGAAGTLSAMGEEGPDVRRALAEALDLIDPGRSWHSDRSGLVGLTSWVASMAGALGKMGEDLILLSQSRIEEVELPQSGGSSTMPQKANPVLPSVLVALARQAIALNAAMQSAMLHRHQRDGAAWIGEWLTLPQMFIMIGRALTIAEALAAGLKPVPETMARNMDASHGAIHAEAVTFALAKSMPRPEAAQTVARLLAMAREQGSDLKEVARKEYPDLTLTVDILGTAPAEARAFTQAVRR